MSIAVNCNMVSPSSQGIVTVNCAPLASISRPTICSAPPPSSVYRQKPSSRRSGSARLPAEPPPGTVRFTGPSAERSSTYPSCTQHAGIESYLQLLSRSAMVVAQ